MNTISAKNLYNFLYRNNLIWKGVYLSDAGVRCLANLKTSTINLQDCEIKKYGYLIKMEIPTYLI